MEYPGNDVVPFNAAIRVAIKRYNHAVTWATRHFISLISISKKYESNFKEISKLHLLVVIYECTSGQRKHRAIGRGVACRMHVRRCFHIDLTIKKKKLNLKKIFFFKDFIREISIMNL